MASRAGPAEHWRGPARRAEALGYDVLLMPDHITDQLAPLPALVAVADATARLRVGSFVFDNDYRNPVMLAKEAATLDLLSGGRLELGIGAGWNTRDYRQLGMPYDPPKMRVERMEEALRLIKSLWTEENVTHEGRHYRVRGATVLPRPVQRPHPPVLVAGGGLRVLRIAGARGADRGARSRGKRARRPSAPHRDVGVGRGADRVAPARAAFRGARAERDRVRRPGHQRAAVAPRRAGGTAQGRGDRAHRDALLHVRIAPLADRRPAPPPRAPRDQLHRAAGSGDARVLAHRRRPARQVPANIAAARGS